MDERFEGQGTAQQGPPDAELMAQVRDGNRDAFALVVDRYKDALVAYLARLSGSRERGEDLAQEAFVRLYRAVAADTYDEQGKLAPLLYRIALNVLRSEERHARRFRALALLLPFAAPRPAVTQERDILRDEAQRQVADAITRLPPAFREPLVLRDIEDWSYEDIAHALDLPAGTVKSRIARGRQQLRELLAPYVLGNGGKAWTTTG